MGREKDLALTHRAEAPDRAAARQPSVTPSPEGSRRDDIAPAPQKLEEVGQRLMMAQEPVKTAGDSVPDPHVTSHDAQDCAAKTYSQP